MCCKIIQVITSFSKQHKYIVHTRERLYHAFTKSLLFNTLRTFCLDTKSTKKVKTIFCFGQY